ncbi:hypothetical protein D7M11_00065 [Paenibacillus ginsengarvi]|uniref:Uncharacterized protein n=2 Tax=Paenibacillus ginsengarvi TaxID=400777 RepID=A0A3B0CLY4_9BACL|nr:hypothetical protein D7M11_00065 [Paenibacillus ginsengarvi]
MVMINWSPRRESAPSVSRSAEETIRLERKIEQMEQTMQQLAKEMKKQSVVVQQLHVHNPVVENVTFRLDALDIEELSGSLNLGNNFDVNFDPNSLFKGAGHKDGKAKQEGGRDAKAAGRPKTAGQTAEPASTATDDSAVELKRTETGYSFRASPPPSAKR